MLYVTTRSEQEVFTAQRTLCERRGSDGGLFVPFRSPEFSCEELAELSAMRFSDCVAKVLNRMFQTRLTGWDVDFSIGRHAIRLQKLNQRMILAECWHNTDSMFSGIVRHLTQRLCHSQAGQEYGSWAHIGIRIAVLFGIYSEMNRSGLASVEQPFDISVLSGDFSAPISCWYARQWGLPIGNIICCCNENGDIWNLFAHGQLRTDAVAKHTGLLEADVAIPEHLEQLIHGLGGTAAVADYLEAFRLGRTYYPDEHLAAKLRGAMYIAVVGESRMADTVSSFFSTNRCVLSPYAALACAGLLDYRSKTGERGIGLILSERSPLCDSGITAGALGIAPETLSKFV